MIENRLSDSHHCPSPIVTDGDSPKLGIDRVFDARSGARVRGEKLFRCIETAGIRISRLLAGAVPGEFNPLSQLGAVANTMFVIATITGILLLFWYSPSVSGAYESVVSMSESPWAAELLRSVHRYSSDVCILFVALHAIQMLAARKFGGARWVAWLTGMLLLGLLWVDGWTGYWLVWDERAQLVAHATARFLDVLPVFPEPLLRSFLTNDGVNSLFFFIVIFAHMLIPIGMGAFLWIHIMRLGSARFFTSLRMALWLTAALVALSLLLPADTLARADMQQIPEAVEIDWFYLMPVWFAERLTGGALWMLLFGTTVVLWGIPWWLTRRKSEPAEVNQKSCNGCTQCMQDCPFNAVEMVPNDNPASHIEEVAWIDPTKCVACGVCVGSCDSASITLPALPPRDVRTFIDEHVRPGRHVAFVCAESAAEYLELDKQGRASELPGYTVIPVPCAGWVHMLMVERALRKGADGVLISGCGIDPPCRLGTRWTSERLAGEREPALRTDRIDREKIRFLRMDRTEKDRFLAAAATFRTESSSVAGRSGSRFVRVAAAALIAVILSGATIFFSDAAYRSPSVDGSEFVVSIKHAGEFVAGKKSDSENQDVLPHMRRERNTSRRRAPVRLRVIADGEVAAERLVEAGGLFNDGLSVGIVRMTLPPGVHSMRVELDTSGRHGQWTHVWTDTLITERTRRRVLSFDEQGRFRIY